MHMHTHSRASTWIRWHTQKHIHSCTLPHTFISTYTQHQSHFSISPLTPSCNSDDLRQRLDSKSPLGEYIASLYDAASYKVANEGTKHINIRHWQYWQLLLPCPYISTCTSNLKATSLLYFLNLHTFTPFSPQVQSRSSWTTPCHRMQQAAAPHSPPLHPPSSQPSLSTHLWWVRTSCPHMQHHLLISRIYSDFRIPASSFYFTDMISFSYTNISSLSHHSRYSYYNLQAFRQSASMLDTWLNDCSDRCAAANSNLNSLLARKGKKQTGAATQGMIAVQTEVCTLKFVYWILQFDTIKDLHNASWHVRILDPRFPAVTVYITPSLYWVWE